MAPGTQLNAHLLLMNGQGRVQLNMGGVHKMTDNLYYVFTSYTKFYSFLSSVSIGE